MFESNVVFVRGRVTSEPRVRELPSGELVTQIEISTQCDGVSVSVPVSAPGTPPRCAAGDEVVVIGSVRRRFFRAGGATQSRTEVIAEEVVLAGRRRSVDRVRAKVSQVLAGP